MYGPAVRRLLLLENLCDRTRVCVWVYVCIAGSPACRGRTEVKGGYQIQFRKRSMGGYGVIVVKEVVACKILCLYKKNESLAYRSLNQDMGNIGVRRQGRLP